MRQRPRAGNTLQMELVAACFKEIIDVTPSMGARPLTAAQPELSAKQALGGRTGTRHRWWERWLISEMKTDSKGVIGSERSNTHSSHKLLIGQQREKASDSPGCDEQRQPFIHQTRDRGVSSGLRMHWVTRRPLVIRVVG